MTTGWSMIDALELSDENKYAKDFRALDIQNRSYGRVELELKYFEMRYLSTI